MLFSIIIPTCNRPDLLQLCLNEIKPFIQKFPEQEYEVIVSDDSVNELSRTMMAAKFPQFIWLKGPQRGPAANRNNGACKAMGKWLIFLDDDCEPSQILLLEYAKAINHNPFTFVFEGAISCPRDFLHSMETAPINENGGCLWSCNFCINKELFFEIGGFDTMFIYPHLEDVDFHKRIIQKHEICFVREAFVIHPPRIYPDGIKLGKYHEYDIYYCTKHGIEYSFYSILKNIFITRVYTILKRPITKYTGLSIINMLKEIYIVTINFNKWRRNFTGVIS